MVRTTRRAPTQRRSQARIERILDAADAELAATGTVGTRGVAARAGVSIGSVYHWFPDKESIALALALHHWDELSAIIESLAARADALDDPIAQALAALADGFRARPGFLALWFSELRTAQLRAATRPSRERVAGSVAEILAVAHPDGDPALRATVARMLTLLGDGILREAFRLDRAGDPLVLREGTEALRAYARARLDAPPG